MATKTATKSKSETSNRRPPMVTTPNNNNTAFTCHFALEKETSGTFRYMQVDGQGNKYGVEAGAELGSVYIRKSAFKGGTVPQKITMVVTPE